MTVASQTCVVRPVCSGEAVAITISPSPALDTKLALHPTVVKLRAPSGQWWFTPKAQARAPACRTAWSRTAQRGASAKISPMLRLVLPKGSLERATLQLFADADLAVNRSSDVAYRATIADPRIDEVRILRPQEIPVYVADGLFDLGITGRDCIEERGSEVVTLGELSYSKATANPAQVVLAVAHDSPAHSLADLANLPGRLRISSEYPELTRRALAAHGVEADIALSYGATEAKVPDIADAVVDMTETGGALRAAGLRVIEILLVSHTELIANPAAAADPDKRHAMEQILTLLQGTLEARGKVLVKLNVSAENLDSVLGVLPSMRAPTVSELSGGGAFALEAVVAKSDINVLIPALRDHGASDILEIPLSKIVH